MRSDVADDKRSDMHVKCLIKIVATLQHARTSAAKRGIVRRGGSRKSLKEGKRKEVRYKREREREKKERQLTRYWNNFKEDVASINTLHITLFFR